MFMVDEKESGLDFYKQKHAINITLASQLRLHDILNRIVNLDANYPIDSPQKQKSYLSLVKQYFISAIPYLSPPDSQKYRSEILDFSIKRVSNIRRGNQKFSFEFDSKLDKRLNEILMELQEKLRPIFTKYINPEDEEDGL